MAIAVRYEVREGAVWCVLEGLGNATAFETALSVAAFRDLGGGYATDGEEVVYQGERIEDAHAPSLVVLVGGYAKDRECVYHDGGMTEAPDLGPWDPPTFVAFDAHYVADARGVFCRRYGYDCYEVVPVEGASADDFEALGLGFARAPIAKKVWLRGEVEPRLDASTLALEGEFFVRDRSRVYHLAYGGKHTDEIGLREVSARPETFRVLGPHYASDAHTVFYFLNDTGDADLADLVALPDVVPAELVLLPDVGPGFAHDARRVFNHGEVEPAVVDPATFRSLGSGFARDRAHAYRMVPELREVARHGYHLEVDRPVLLEGVDPDALVVVGPGEAEIAGRRL